MRSGCCFLLTILVGVGACATEPEFQCTAWCLSDSVDDGIVQHEVSDSIQAADLGAAVTACETWLTCNAGPSDQTRCLCTEVH